MLEKAKVPVTLRIDPAQCAEIDRIAAVEQRTRSTILNFAIEQFIKGRRNQNAPLDIDAKESQVIRTCKLLQELRTLTRDELQAIYRELTIGKDAVNGDIPSR